MIVKIIGIACNEADLRRRFSNIVLGNSEKIIDSNDDVEYNYPIIIYEINNKIWIAEEDDYLWALMTDIEQNEVDKKLRGENE